MRMPKLKVVRTYISAKLLADGVAIDKPAFVVIDNQYINGFEEQTSTTIPHT